MKNKILFLFLLIIAVRSDAQVSVTILQSHEVSCHGGNDGELFADISAGPGQSYTILWLPGGQTTSSISALTAQNYSVTVTLNATGASATDAYVLTEPAPLSVSLTPSTQSSGHNVSCFGSMDGSIDAYVSGGRSPYTYQWSPGICSISSFRNLGAANYTVTVFDAKGCMTNNSIVLSEPPLLSVVSAVPTLHNGYGISCFKGEDGQINLTVAGGAGGNSYRWNNGSFDMNPVSLRAGVYEVEVTDMNGCTARTPNPVVLSQPELVEIELSPSLYPSGYNISCFNCFNGSIYSSVSGGVFPYAYQWSPVGQQTPDATSLGEGIYTLNVTDANGCTSEASAKLKEPERSDWTVNGNSNTDPASNFIGTTDAADFTLRTNATERMRISMDGKVGIGTTAPQKNLDVYGDARITSGLEVGGNIRLNVLNGLSNAIVTVDLNGHVSKTDIPNDASKVLLGNGIFGSVPSGNVWSVDNDNVNSWNTNSGCIAIGSSAFPSNKTWPADYKLAVNGKVIATDFMVRMGTDWPDYVFRKDYRLAPLDEVKDFIAREHHLPGIPSSEEIASSEISVSKLLSMQMEKIEELTLYLLLFSDEISRLKNEKVHIESGKQ